MTDTLNVNTPLAHLPVSQTLVRLALCLCLLSAHRTTAASQDRSLQFFGIQGVSAALALDPETLVAAGPQDNRLRVYNVTRPQHPPATFDLSDFLGVDRDAPVDIAGVTRMGDRLYWVGSHTRDRDGQVRPERYCLFATAVHRNADDLRLVPVGKPYTALVQTLVRVHTMRGLQLARSARLDQDLTDQARLNLAPQKEGLHIAALCASADPEILYIGFRNPRPIRVVTGTAHALVVPLDNARDVLEKGEQPIFGEGMLWDLDGLGILSFEYAPLHRAYFILAGSHDGQERRVLYRWSGMKMNSPERLCAFAPSQQNPMPDTLVPFGHAVELLFLTGSQAAPADTPGFWMNP